MGAVKVATCCYCGTRAVLVLAGKTRHELSCGTCGAPLSKMKMFPNVQARVTAPAATPTRPKPQKRPAKAVKCYRNKPKKKRNISRLGKKVFEEIWDVFEDVFD